MADLLTRRAYLLAAIQATGQPVTSQRAAQLLNGSPWPTTGRNTARKDLRGLARAGLLTVSVTAKGRTTYHLISTTTGEDGQP
ncbi:hypothetical protein ACFUN7_24515 [Streptomyces sp. NPDC057236]|uniref:hypothetical protein n=1 Tax=Streptomyces sp. NPDC057236 TaxID=3346059 RepID=UPI00363891C6